MLLVPARFIFRVRVFFYYLLLVTFVRTGITFTLYPVLINWVLSWIFNKVKLLLCSFVFPVEVACIPLSLYHSWIWLGGVESVTVHFVLFAWVLFVFTLRSEVEGKIQLILFTGITLYSLILRRYQYDNFHLHLTIIVQITNQIKSKQKGESTNSAHLDAESGNQTQATMVEGECSHHCANPAPHSLCN